jgi:hypothetical protein
MGLGRRTFLQDQESLGSILDLNLVELQAAM